jgi:hypothetical protein
MTESSSLLPSIPRHFTVSSMAMEATEINLTVTMIESSFWLSSILGLSTVSFSSIEMEATEIKKRLLQ